MDSFYLHRKGVKNMNELVTLAEAAAPVDLGATFTSMLGSLTSSFNGAVPAVAGVAGGIVAVMIGACSTASSVDPTEIFAPLPFFLFSSARGLSSHLRGSHA